MSDRRRPTVSRLMLAIAALAVILGLGRWATVLLPEANARKLKSRGHAAQEAFWLRYVGAADRGRLIVSRMPITNSKEYFDRIGFDTGPGFSYECSIWESDIPPQSREGFRLEKEGRAICRDRAAYHGRMARKWSQSARTPWRPVEPDGPKPLVEIDEPRSF